LALSAKTEFQPCEMLPVKPRCEVARRTAATTGIRATAARRRCRPRRSWATAGCSRAGVEEQPGDEQQDQHQGQQQREVVPSGDAIGERLAILGQRIAGERPRAQRRRAGRGGEQYARPRRPQRHDANQKARPKSSAKIAPRLNEKVSVTSASP